MEEELFLQIHSPWLAYRIGIYSEEPLSRNREAHGTPEMRTVHKRFMSRLDMDTTPRLLFDPSKRQSVHFVPPIKNITTL